MAGVLVGHDYEEALGGIFVCLQLVVRAMHSGASGQEEQELARCMRVVCWLGHVCLDVIEFGDLLSAGG